MNRGETQAHTISLDEGRLLGGEPSPPNAMEQKERYAPISYATLTTALELTPGKADLIEWTEGALICRDCASGKVLWDALHPKTSFNSKHDPAKWMPSLSPTIGRGELLEPAVKTSMATGRVTCSGPFDGPRRFSGVGKKMVRCAGIMSPSATGQAGPVTAVPELVARFFLSDSAAGLPRCRRGGTSIADGTPGWSRCSPSRHRQKVRGNSAEAGTSSALIQQVLYKRVAVALSGRSGLRLWARPIDQDFDTIPAEPERRLSIVARSVSAADRVSRRNAVVRARAGDGPGAGGTD